MSSHPNPPAVTDAREALTRLLLAAKDDAAFRRQFLFLLRAPALQRRALVNAAIEEMARRNEAPDARAAFALLATDEGAKAALEILQPR